MHADISWSLPKKQSRRHRKEFLPLVEYPKGTRKNALVAAIHMFKGDNPSQSFMDEIKKVRSFLHAESLVLLPFAHLSEDKSRTMELLEAFRLFSELRLMLAERFRTDVPMLPFGVDKYVDLKLKAHPYSVHYRDFL